MILKEYQQRALAAVRGLLDELARQRDRAEKVRAVDPEWKLDWAREAWEKRRAGASVHEAYHRYR